MKALTLRLDDDLHKQLKIKMATEGITLQEYLVVLIKNDLTQNKDKK